MKNSVSIKVCKEDLELMRSEAKQNFLKHHPELRGKHITDKHMFAQVVKYYIDNP